eukprot:1161503-Pelagomonas_calceolata.AAC.3
MDCCGLKPICPDHSLAYKSGVPGQARGRVDCWRLHPSSRIPFLSLVMLPFNHALACGPVDCCRLKPSKRNHGHGGSPSGQSVCAACAGA